MYLNILLLVVTLIFFHSWNSRRRIAHVPGPFTWPLIGNTLEIVKEQTGESIMKYRKMYGPIFKIRLMWMDRVVITDPASIHHVLVTNQYNYTKKMAQYDQLSRILGKGLVTISDIDQHRWLRGVIGEAFSYTNIKLYFPIFTMMGTKLMSKWASDAQAKREVNVIEDLGACTLDVIGRAAFGSYFNAVDDLAAKQQAHDSSTTSSSSSKHDVDDGKKEGNIIDDDDEGTRLRDSLNQSFGNFEKMSVMDFIPVLNRLTRTGRMQTAAAQRLSGQMEEIIERKQTGKIDVDQRDLLDILVKLKDEEGTSLSVPQLSDQSKTFLLAGHETSSTALTWILYLLAQHPEIDTRLAAEVHSKLGQWKEGASSLPTVDMLDSMKYLGKVVKEAMRVFPPVPLVARKCEEDDVLPCGVLIPKGMTVTIPIYALHHAPEIWGDPETFNPDRWEDANEGGASTTTTTAAANKIPQGAYIPFLLGARNCIGSRFALLEVKALLAMTIQRYRFRLAPGHPPVRRSARVTMRPTPQLKLLIETR
eukprot:TRINITY_DN2274_c4_g1_i1.p1 TRINITY_DN2274_c4_g1~~TRINITY_DN2274_c4_g1_i1.p1  ORF type:complete len:533 (+),score=122.55 TRINITY_DN2274_c4_g1_i1:116-1714(+)